MKNAKRIFAVTIRGAMIAAVLCGLAAGTVYAQAAPEPAPHMSHGQDKDPHPGPETKDEQVIRLSDAFPGLEAAAGHVFRARQIELPPGGRTGIMKHAGRPSITHVTAGEVLEIREGAPASIAHKAGDTVLARADVTHAWENAGNVPAMLLIVEITPDP